MQAVEQLLEVEERRGEKAYEADTLCVGISRLQVSASDTCRHSNGAAPSKDPGARNVLIFVLRQCR